MKLKRYDIYQTSKPSRIFSDSLATFTLDSLATFTLFDAIGYWIHEGFNA